MKVREGNADLISFYLKQGHRLTKSQGHWFGEKNHRHLSFQCFPSRMRRNFSAFTLLFFSHISQCYSLMHFKFGLDGLALWVLRFLGEGMWEPGVLTSRRNRRLSSSAGGRGAERIPLCDAQCWRALASMQKELEKPGEKEESLPSVQGPKGR